MGKIGKILEKGPVEGQTTEVYPVTSTKAVYDENNKRLDNIITGLQESIYLNIPIPISRENTTESMAQNVKNIADYVEKAKAAGIADVNGMAVTCIIDGDYSGIGYLYSYGDSFNVQGVLVPDDLVDNMCFNVFTGRYSTVKLITDAEEETVTSNMLDTGARNPIILTSNTTEVDEETYQKLLSDDVDVLLKTSTENANLCTLTYKINSGDYLALYFTCLSIEGIGMGDLYTYAYEVDITKTSPHTCSMTENQNGSFNDILLNSGYVNESTLNPILQQINLTGTDADRKAKLDQFEADWKALTGANNLIGARFVGTVGTPTGDSTMVFTWNDVFTCYTGVGFDDTHNNYKCMVQSNGTIGITPLFSHLEAIEILTDNTTESKQKNIDNLNAYKENLENLGVDVFHKNFQIPVTIYNAYAGSLYYSSYDKVYVGVLFATDDGYGVYFIKVELDGTYSEVQFAFNDGVEQVKALANAVKAFGAIELKARNNAANKAALTTYLKTLTNAKVITSNGYSVPVRITGYSQEYHGILNIGTGVLLSGVVTDVNVNHYYPFKVRTTDGVITFDENNYLPEKTEVTALERNLVSAINELAGKVAALEAKATEVTKETTK